MFQSAVPKPDTTHAQFSRHDERISAVEENTKAILATQKEVVATQEVMKSEMSDMKSDISYLKDQSDKLGEASDKQWNALGVLETTVERGFARMDVGFTEIRMMLSRLLEQ